jgi:hypothetical protein
MSFQGKRELLVQVAPRYREASHRQKSPILDEFVAATGYARKYAIRLLTHPVAPPGPIKRPREPRYGPAVQEPLAIAWAAANRICAKRLVPFLPQLVPTLERHGHLVLSDDLRAQLLAISPATADRLLRPLRERRRGVSTTKAGLLKHQVPVRTFAEWDQVRPGFVEADLVAHCGSNASGAFLYTLVLTDIATGWTECLPLLHRGQQAVVQALGHARRLLPFPLLGLDTDNGGEFLNAELLAYCEREAITFTRSRAYEKNDQCFVEQKNGSIVRQLVGYDRFEGERAYRQLGELYRAVRLYVNFFQPSMKLQAKQRSGGRTQRRYDAAQTPYQRLVAAGVLAPEQQARLAAIFAALDPVRLLQQLETLQDALWRHAIVPMSAGAAGGEPSPAIAVRFDVHRCGLATDATLPEDRAAATPSPVGSAEPGQPRQYHRTRKRLGPRTYRTRPDPFEAVWPEVVEWLAAAPERTAKSLLQALQARHPGRYPDGQLRTLQRRVHAWRAQTLLAFDERWLTEDPLTDETLPRPLRVVAAPDTSTETAPTGADGSAVGLALAGGD